MMDSNKKELIMGNVKQHLTYAQVETIVNEIDPLGLIKIGAPSDEYSPEIKDIVRRRNFNNSSLNAAEIRVIFEYWFYPECISKEQAETISIKLQNIFMYA
jgi:hypothetical protein